MSAPSNTELCQLIGAKVTEARQRKGWTQADLARELGVSFQAIWHWEGGGVRPPNVKRLAEIAIALDVSVSELVEEI